jgi:signal transduction histidine kinase/CHASE3 domain sensor protein
MNIRALIAFGLAFFLVVLVIFLNRRSFKKMEDYTRQVNHTREVISSLERVSAHFKSAQVYSPLQENAAPEFYSLYKKEAEGIRNELVNIKSLVKDNPHQVLKVREISDRVQEQMPALMARNIKEIIDAGEAWRLDSLYKIHILIDETIREEHRLLDEGFILLNNSKKQTNLWSTLLFLGALVLILAVLISNVLLQRKGRWLEGFLESVLNTSDNGIVHFKAVRKSGEVQDFKLYFANKAAQKLLGKKVKEMFGKRLEEFPVFSKDHNLRERFTEVVNTSKPTQFEIFFQENDGPNWFFVSLAKLNDGVTATFHDISEIKKFQEDLKTNITELERSNEELEQYAYVASHDLQEPLRKIRSFGSYLLETQAERLDERGRKQLEKIMNASERMSVLIKDILSFSSLKRQQSFERTDLNETISQVLLDLDLLITQKGAIIEPQRLPVIEAIPLQMHQLFYNLLNNALKFSRAGVPPHIRILCRKLKEADKQHESVSLRKDLDFYEIIVQDNGIGFSQEYSEQIFALFKRLYDKQSFPGSGIGLALCKKVALNHQGDISAQSEEGRGASFYIYLPVTQEPIA